MLSFAAAGIYLVVALTCGFAASVARKDLRFADALRFWLLASAFFVLLALMRTYSIEDLLRDQLRSILVELDVRDHRRAAQAIATLLVIAIGVFISRLAWSGWKTSAGSSIKRLVLLAKFAIAAMVGLIALRLISLHVMDAILFRGLIGSIRLNWILDLGLSSIVCVSALQFSRKLRRKIGRRC